MSDPFHPFHDVGKLFPGDKEVISVTPDTKILDAVRLMRERRFSQLPVVDGGGLRGVFTFWSLARHLQETPRLGLQDVCVEDAMEQLPTVSVNHALDAVIDAFKTHEAVLLTSPVGLQAIATPIDALTYFVKVARPFVLLGEIELSLRALIDRCAPGPKLKECIDISLGRGYRERGEAPPEELSEMTFEEYRSIIGSKENWPLFEGILGRNRASVIAKLARIRDIRNDVFHFRKDVSVLDYEALVYARDWLLDRTKASVAKAQGNAK